MGPRPGDPPLRGWLPVLLRVEGLRALVLGGGRQGTHRALQLARAGARVRVAAREFSSELVEAARRGLVELVEADLRAVEALEGLIGWADLVVVATSDAEVNREAREAALRMGKLVNDVTSAASGNVVVPFHGEAPGGLVVAVSSLGRAGVAARAALEKCLEAIASDPEVEVIAETFAELKRRLKEAEPDPEARMRAYRAVAGDPLYRSLARSGRAREALERALAVALEAIRGQGSHPRGDLAGGLGVG
ncbi:MAG: bifunctional precorrin-2 dehydrogenase/sirohydrochlorin ferrochelatase [Desulfurococcales archaeon]|nr:bifunctional precorrin-2 dehydrogenase/sirohydrochlorin ferrochelatase [Desulfurococcales archaeon]